jgi:hypothetical protein
MVKLRIFIKNLVACIKNFFYDYLNDLYTDQKLKAVEIRHSIFGDKL